MSVRRQQFGLVTLDSGDILAVGGYDGAKYLSTAEVFSHKDLTWRPVRAMTDARTAFGIALARYLVSLSM